MTLAVSILIPCYNAEAWVAQAVESALAQGRKGIEVIVYNDASTDNSIHALTRFSEIDLMADTKNRGGNVARNRLLAAASGEWIQFLDADDLLEPGKIAADLAFLKNHPHVDVIASPTGLLDHGKDFKKPPLKSRGTPLEKDLWRLWLGWRMPQTGGFLWRKDTLETLGAWDTAWPNCQDYALTLKALKADLRWGQRTGSQALYRQWSNKTVSKDDLHSVLDNRNRLTEEALAYLENEGALDGSRLAAAKQSFFEMARHLASVGTLQAAQSYFEEKRGLWGAEPAGPAAPPLYRAAFRAFGFSGAERIAKWMRRR